jgi:hypothetical protein
VAGDGNPQRMEIISFSPDIHDAPGACLRHIEGSSHTLFCMTPEEAYQIGQFLIRSAQKSLRDFKAKEGTK